MSIDRPVDLKSKAHVVSLEQQRKLRQHRDVETEAHNEPVADFICDSGVCKLDWSPKKKSAA